MSPHHFPGSQLLIALALTFCNGIAHGELKWDRQRAQLAPGPADTVVEAAFGFVNAGSEPVVIEKIESSCGCTTAVLPKMAFEPGERSELAARFDTAGRRGVQTKTVTVYIKGAKEPVVLTLVVTIPDLVKLSPEVLFWTKGEVAKAKTIVCDVMPGLPVRILKVTSSDPRLPAKLDTIREGGKYTITVTPDTTLTASFALLTIEFEFKDQKKSIRSYAQVRQSPQ
jgi:hypothetical protein